MRNRSCTRRELLALGARVVAGAVAAGCAPPRPSPPREETAMHMVTSRDGTPIGYRRGGAGPPLLLVHGTTADHTRWARIAPTFERYFTVHAMDRRGRGASGDTPPYAVAREAEDVAAVVEAIGEPTCLLGHSFGAICSLEAALLGDGVRRLVLYEPPVPTGIPVYPPGLPERIEALVQEGDRETALLLFFREVVRVPEHELEAMRSLPVWRVRVALAHTIPREMRVDELYRLEAERFRELHTPTLLLVGGDSPPLMTRATAAVDAALPDSRVVVMPGQQHVAMDTAPTLFAGEVLRFLLPE